MGVATGLTVGRGGWLGLGIQWSLIDTPDLLDWRLS